MHLRHHLQVFSDRYPLVGPALWMMCGQYFLVQIIVSAAWSDPYSLRNNAISDLGSTVCANFGSRYVCSPLHTLMNLSFITLGLTMFWGAVLIYREFNAKRTSATGFTGMALAGIGTIGVGIVPENTISSLHVLSAALPFLVGNLAIGLLGLVLPLPRRLRIYSLLTSFVTLTALCLLLSNHDLGLGFGGMERLVSYPQTLWLMAFGLYVSRNHFILAWRRKLTPSNPLSNERKP